MASVDSTTARQNVKVFLRVKKENGTYQRVGRVQSFREDQTNNVQVLDELGSEFAVELAKGITHYTFSIARFYCRADVFDALKLGQTFALEINDQATNELLEQFGQCAISAISRDYTVGQAVVAESVTVVAIGSGVQEPAVQRP